MRILGILAFAAAVYAQPAYSSLSSDAITRSAARVGFNVTGSGNYYLQFGLTASYGYRTPAAGEDTTAVQQLTGMEPSTIYHWRACNEDYAAPAGCSSDQTLTTAADTQAPVAEAVLPTLMNTTYPAITGSVLYVAADCSNFAAKLTEAAALDGNLNHELRFSLGTVCAGQVELPGKSGINPTGAGYIILRPDVADSLLPPEGTRITRDWEANLPLFINGSLGYSEAASNPGTCSPVEYYWDTTQAGANKYKACLTLNTWTLVSATTGYTSGSGAPGSSCPTQGRYYFNTAGTANQSLYRCVTLNASTSWIRLPASGASDDFALANYYGSALRGYRFMGLRFQPGDMNGSIIANLLALGRGGGAMSNIIIDRCIFYTGAASSSMRAVGLDGAGTALIDSFIDLRTVPTAERPYNPDVNQFAVIIGAGTGPFKIVNNYIRGAGLLVFVTDNSSVVPRDDFEIRRNTFTYNEDHRCGGPTSDGFCRDVRSPMEFKRGRRVWIDGNLFENYWSTVGVYPAIIVTPRASGVTGMDGNTYQVRDFTITNNVFRNGTGFLQVLSGETNSNRTTWVTERFTIRNNLFYGISNYASNYGGYNDARGTIVWHGGISDMIFENNTVYKNTGSGPAFLAITDQRPFDGLRWRNNILWLTQHGLGGGNGIRYSPGSFPDGTSSSATTAAVKLNKTAMRVPALSYVFTGNAIVTATTGDTAAEQPGYPSGNYWPGDNTAGEAALGFADAAGGNFRLLPGSAYATLGMGMYQDGIEQARGLTLSTRARALTTSGATISYYAPDATAACSVDWGTSSTLATFTRTADTPAGVRKRNVAITGQASGVAIYYRVNCVQSSAIANFTTN